ncbi:MAG: MltA domain-containing protein [Bdellovibrionales bacterium]
MHLVFRFLAFGSLVFTVPSWAANYVTPTKALPISQFPQFTDDYELRGLKTAMARQLQRFAQKDLRGTIKFGTTRYPLSRMKVTLEKFSDLVDDFRDCRMSHGRDVCFASLNSAIRSDFRVYVPALTKDDPRFGDDEFAFFTGYHTMPVHAAEVAHGPFQYPFYRNPQNSSLNKSRVEIDFFGALRNKGLELGYATSLFDIYLLHVQGAGTVDLVKSDGSTAQFYVNYDGTNGQRFDFISKYMIQKGYISSHSIPAQRKFLRQHPELWQDIYATCPSYVWMKATGEPPLGNDSTALTISRSIAQDSGLYSFKGTLAFVRSTRPVESGQYDLEEEDSSKVPFTSFARFFLDQDTGGAIKGKARADLYFGEDEYAYFSAMHMKQTGQIYYIMAK